MTRPESSGGTRPADADLDRILAVFDGLMHRLMASHAPELNLIDLTMSQTKALYLVLAAGQLRMSELAARLGITANALRINAHRIRMSLETCVKQCLGH